MSIFCCFVVLSYLHELLSLSHANTVALLRGLSSTVLKVYDALAASRTARRWTYLDLQKLTPSLCPQEFFAAMRPT
jgi:hypothetical protein